jgi:hypothetical protein
MPRAHIPYPNPKLQVPENLESLVFCLFAIVRGVKSDRLDTTSPFFASPTGSAFGMAADADLLDPVFDLGPPSPNEPPKPSFPSLKDK